MSGGNGDKKNAEKKKIHYVEREKATENF